MSVDDLRLGGAGGGRAGSGGSFYHVSFRSGSRAGGACAKSAHDYVTRENEYGGEELDAAVYTESGHIPSWAEGDAAAFWDAADTYERANGRLYVSGDFALPRDLPLEDQIELARAFAHELTDDERLPYTLAIHEGRDEEGNEHNPHAHIMFSERQNDGIDRSPDQWFRRANPDDPAGGGAAKSRTFHGPAWVENARERWAQLTNEALERAGRSERVDHRSYERQGLDREPGEHFGPAAAHIVGRGQDHERLGDAATRADEAMAVEELDGQIAALEAARAALLRDGFTDEEREPEARDYSHSSFEGRSDDRSWGR